MSCELYWEILRNNSCFLVRRNGYVLTSEPNNLTNLNSFKHSGLVGCKTVGMTAISPKGVILTVCRKNAACNAPARRMISVRLTKTSGRAVKATKAVVGGTYRPDLVKVAMCRAKKIFKSQRSAKSLKTKKTCSTKTA